MRVYCRFNIVVLFVATVPHLHHIGHQGGGIGGGGLVDDFPGPHRVPSELASVYRKYKVVSGANFNIPQDPGRELSKGKRIQQ